MSEKKSKLGIILKGCVVLALIGGIGFAILYGFRSSALVEEVVLAKAVDAVTGSVTVKAKPAIFDLKSELPGTVKSCELLDPEAKQPFKRDDILLQLDTTELTRQITQARHDHDAAEQREAVTFAKNAVWTATKEKLDVAARSQKKGEPATDEMIRLQRELDAVATRDDPGRITAEENWKNAERYEKLDRVPAQEVKQKKRLFDAIEDSLRVAEFNKQQARANYLLEMEGKERELAKMSVKAPFDGRVKEVFVQPGSIIGSGTTVATLYSSTRTVEGKISEEDIGKVHVGDKAKVRLLKYPREEFDATVTQIQPIAEENTQRYTVFLDVALDPEKLIPFSTGEVTITVGERENRPRIARRALFNDKTGDNNVYVVKSGTVEKRRIKPGFVGLNFAEVAEGLKPGEQVITDDLEQFRDGQRVRVEIAK